VKSPLNLHFCRSPFSK